MSDAKFVMVEAITYYSDKTGKQIDLTIERYCSISPEERIRIMLSRGVTFIDDQGDVVDKLVALRYLKGLGI